MNVMQTNRKFLEAQIEKLKTDMGRLGGILAALVAREGRVILSEQELKRAAEELTGVRTSTSERGLVLEVVPREDAGKSKSEVVTP